MSERGLYVQGFTVGFATGYDDTEGVTLSLFQSVSVGVSADVWASVNISLDNPYFFEFEGVTPYVGIGVPTGAPTVITGTLQANMINGDAFGTVGYTLSTDFAEVGYYWEGPAENLFPSNSSGSDGISDPTVLAIRDHQQDYSNIPDAVLEQIVTSRIEEFSSQFGWTVLQPPVFEVLSPDYS